MLVKWLSALYVELMSNGKMLIGYLIMLIPQLSNYPMILDAIQQFSANPTKDNAIKLLAQVIMAFGAGHRLVKIVKGVIARLGL